LEYAERGRQLYRPRAPTPFVMGLILALFVTTLLLNWGDIGPPADADRLGLIAVLVAGLFVVGHVVVRRRAGRLGLLCPTCGHYPLGVRRFLYVTEAQVAKILEGGALRLVSQGPLSR
jgi:hypothetical protein